MNTLTKSILLFETFALGLSACGALPPTPEPIIVQPADVYRDYRKFQQTIMVQAGKIVDCLPPDWNTEVPPRGFEYHVSPFDWEQQKQNLPVLEINGISAPILTPYDVSPEQIARTTQLFNTYPQMEIAGDGINQEPPKPVETLLVNYKSIRDLEYVKQPDGTCLKVDNVDPPGNPTDVFYSFFQDLNEATNGEIGLAWNTVNISEDELPLTTDPNRGPGMLIDIYGKTMDYQAIAEMAVTQGVRTVFVMAGPTAGMLESTNWKDEKSGQLITIFGLNNTVDKNGIMESVLHNLEDTLGFIDNEALTTYSGRLSDYDFPYNVSDQDMNDYYTALAGQTYFAKGFGTVHQPPNGVAHYNYDSPIPVYIPGQAEPIDSSAWGSSRDGFFKWWLQHMPKDMLSKYRESLRGKN
jgi:hypothetical protein